MSAPSNVIMVVEDDADVRESLAEVLSDSGFEPVLATNGEEALTRLRALQTRPSLILLDVMMPVMDGQQFRTEQLKDEGLKEIPVVVLSAHANVGEAAEGMGVAGYMRKPVDLAELLAMVERHRG